MKHFNLLRALPLQQLFIIYLLFHSLCIYSEEYKLSDKLTITDQQLRDIESNLPRITEERLFFHWTSVENGMRWCMQGFVDDDEVKFYNKPANKKQSYGPGIYWSTSPSDSSQFGEFPVAFKVNTGTPIYSDDIVKKYIGRILDPIEKAELGEIIPFAEKITNTWWLTHSSKNTQNVTFDKKHSATIIKANSSDFFMFFAKIKQIALSSDSKLKDDYYVKLSNLLQYQDGLSLYRSIKINPSNPVAEFEPEHFEQFKQAISNNNILTDIKRFYNVGSTNEIPPSAVNEILPRIYFNYLGITNTNSDAAYRTTPIRAGGDGPNKNFFATPTQLGELKMNPYLKVDAVITDEGDGFWVSYDYPSVTNYKRLKGMISDDFYHVLEMLTPDDLLDVSKTSQLNNRLVKELLVNLLAIYRKKGLPAEEFTRKMISIHPFNDYNGRTIRLINQSEDRNSKLWSDFDFLLPINIQKKFNSKANMSFAKLQNALAVEFVDARISKRMPDYASLKEWEDLLEPFNIFNITGQSSALKINSNDDFKNIASRDISHLLQDKFGMGWDISTLDSLVIALEESTDPNLAPYRNSIEKNIGHIMLNAIRSGDSMSEETLQRLTSLVSSDKYREILKYFNDVKVARDMNILDANANSKKNSLLTELNQRIKSLDITEELRSQTRIHLLTTLSPSPEFEKLVSQIVVDMVANTQPTDIAKLLQKTEVFTWDGKKIFFPLFIFKELIQSGKLKPNDSVYNVIVEDIINKIMKDVPGGPNDRYNFTFRLKTFSNLTKLQQDALRLEVVWKYSYGITPNLKHDLLIDFLNKYPNDINLIYHSVITTFSDNEDMHALLQLIKNNRIPSDFINVLISYESLHKVAYEMTENEQRKLFNQLFDTTKKQPIAKQIEIINRLLSYKQFDFSELIMPYVTSLDDDGFKLFTEKHDSNFFKSLYGKMPDDIKNAFNARLNSVPLKYNECIENILSQIQMQ